MNSQEEMPVNAYKLRDLNFAAFLLCQEGIELFDLIPIEGKENRYEFVLSMDEKIQPDPQKFRREYYARKTRVDPMTFSSKQRDLKTLIYSQMKFGYVDKRFQKPSDQTLEKIKDEESKEKENGSKRSSQDDEK